MGKLILNCGSLLINQVTVPGYASCREAYKTPEEDDAVLYGTGWETVDDYGEYYITYPTQQKKTYKNVEIQYYVHVEDTDIETCETLINDFRKKYVYLQSLGYIRFCDMEQSSLYQREGVLIGPLEPVFYSGYHAADFTLTFSCRPGLLYTYIPSSLAWFNVPASSSVTKEFSNDQDFPAWPKFRLCQAESYTDFDCSLTLIPTVGTYISTELIDLTTVINIKASSSEKYTRLDSYSETTFNAVTLDFETGEIYPSSAAAGITITTGGVVTHNFPSLPGRSDFRESQTTRLTLQNNTGNALKVEFDPRKVMSA